MLRISVLLAVATSCAAFTATTPATKILSVDQVRSIQLDRERELRKEHDVTAWNRLFVEVPERPDPVPLQQDPLPADFPPGCLLRLGPNGAAANEGFMDGDGMIQCVTFPPDSNGSFSSTYVDTQGRKLEKLHNKRFKGTLGSVPRGLPLLGSVLQNSINFRTLQGQKDTCNTALAVSGDRILACMEQCPPSEVQVTKNGRVETVASNCSLDGCIEKAPVTGGTLSAHGRTIDKERIVVSYNSAERPFVRVDTFEEGWKLKRSIGVDIPVPTMMHDCAVTENYVVLLDFPLTIRTSRFLKDQFPVEYEPGNGARIGLLRRDAGEGTTMWFDCKPGVILHAANAFETEDGKVVVQALRSEPSAAKGYLEEYSASFLYEYELDLDTKTVKECCLNAQEVLEFPVINDEFTGKPIGSVYCNQIRSIGGTLETHRQPETGITLDGVTKLALQGEEKGQVVGKFSLPERWFGVSEPTVVPKMSGRGEYVLLIATYVPEGSSWRDIPESSLRSQVIMLDGDRLDSGPVWLCELPYHVPYGLHSSFLQWDLMK